ncbi:uncharacterized protein LOC112556221 isoform X2 [Pomacea canaliculata]|uniref:uncharacterized protein LOC112556221 isoform X2 n=1 Tax=Pomacea canaliculata TaxID=400727 RepID=UPI000D72B6E8|nr:uncharacterized protein LOC112556221 isoform X2 [Pomacea canaliculata]
MTSWVTRSLPSYQQMSTDLSSDKILRVLHTKICDIEVRTIISNSSDSDQVECIIPVAEDRVQLNLSCKVDVSGEQVEILHSPGNNESTEFHLVGQCVANVCTSAAPNVYNVTYKTGFGLEMTTVHSVERHTVGGVWMCRVRNPVSSENDFYKIAKCRIEVIHVPQPSDIVCDVKLRTTDWVVEGWCTVAKIYSFYKMYNCSWHRTNGAEWLIPSENISFSMKSYIDPQNKREYNSGNCSFKHSLTPFVDASYKYHAIIQPGEVLAEAQTLKIEAPSLPVVRCKAGEGLNCTCETSNIGEPKGTLLWKAGLDVLARGEPGQSFLRLGLQDLSIFESDETEVTCELLWAKSFVTRHRIVPDGKPYIRSFTMNGLSGELVTTEKSFVTFECSVSGKPAPRVRILKGAYPYPTSGQTELDALQKNTAVIFTLSDVSCTDSSIYTCVARNDEGFEYIRYARLRVECAPHLITQTSKSTFREPLQLLYNPPKGHSLRLNLLAYPFLSGWELSLAGQKKATRNSDRLNVSCLHADKDNNNKLVCFITARGIKQEDTGMHVLRLSNSRGVLDVPFLVKIRRPETIAGRTMTAAFIVMTCLLTAIAFAIIAIVLQTKRLSQGGSPNTNGPIYKGNLNPDLRTAQPSRENPTCQAVC